VGRTVERRLGIGCLLSEILPAFGRSEPKGEAKLTTGALSMVEISRDCGRDLLTKKRREAMNRFMASSAISLQFRA
jgi:hypothetical protein